MRRVTTQFLIFFSSIMLFGWIADGCTSSSTATIERIIVSPEREKSDTLIVYLSDTEAYEMNDARLSISPPDEFVPADVPPEAIYRVAPVYPEAARLRRVGGTVWVKAWVTSEGRVRRAVIQASDDDVFNKPALRCLMSWRFSPAIYNGKGIDVWVSVPLNFKRNLSN